VGLCYFHRYRCLAEAALAFLTYQHSTECW
jgi:hypothetical protein